MKLIVETRNEIDEVGIEQLAQELGVSEQEALKGAIHDRFSQLANQVAESNPESAQHSKSTWSIHFE